MCFIEYLGVFAMAVKRKLGSGEVWCWLLVIVYVNCTSMCNYLPKSEHWGPLAGRYDYE